MPTVKLKGGKDKVFPYNAMGKAQAHHYAKMHGGTISVDFDWMLEWCELSKVVVVGVRLCSCVALSQAAYTNANKNILCRCIVLQSLGVLVS